MQRWHARVRAGSAGSQREFFGGYSFVDPGTDVHGLLPGAVLPVNSRVESNPRGAGASITFNFNRWFGLTGDISGDLNSGEKGVAMRIDDAEFFNLSAGPKKLFAAAIFPRSSKLSRASIAWLRKSSGAIATSGSWLAAVLI